MAQLSSGQAQLLAVHVREISAAEVEKAMKIHRFVHAWNSIHACAVTVFVTSVPLVAKDELKFRLFAAVFVQKRVQTGCAEKRLKIAVDAQRVIFLHVKSAHRFMENLEAKFLSHM